MIKTILFTYGIGLQRRSKAERTNTDVSWDSQREGCEGFKRLFGLFFWHRFIYVEGRGLGGGPHGKHEAVEVTVKRLNAQGAETEANPVSVGKYLLSLETASAHGITPKSRIFVWDSFSEHTTQPKVLLLVTFLFALSSWHFVNKCTLS